MLLNLRQTIEIITIHDWNQNGWFSCGPKICNVLFFPQLQGLIGLDFEMTAASTSTSNAPFKVKLHNSIPFGCVVALLPSQIKKTNENLSSQSNLNCCLPKVVTNWWMVVIRWGLRGKRRRVVKGIFVFTACSRRFKQDLKMAPNEGHSWAGRWLPLR